jgi:hypothetical protein
MHGITGLKSSPQTSLGITKSKVQSAQNNGSKTHVVEKPDFYVTAITFLQVNYFWGNCKLPKNGQM